MKFRTRSPASVRTRRPSMAAAPPGFPDAAGCSGTAKVKSCKAEPTRSPERACGSWLDRGFDLSDAAHTTCIRTPGGRPAWMPAVFGADMDVRCENGDDTTHSLSGVEDRKSVV